VPCRPKDVSNEINDDNCLINNDKEMLATSLNLGEHFTVVTIEDNNKGDDFWILIYESLAMVEEVSKIDC
jgi:predicted nuclease of predicted toxin-antitoxin system